MRIDKIHQKTRFRKYHHLHAIRILKLHPILLDMLNKNGKGIIYENVPMNVICKNLGYKNLHNFEMRFNFLFQKELDKDFGILKIA